MPLPYSTKFLALLLAGLFPFFPVEARSEIAETPDVETASDQYKLRFRGKTGKWFFKKQADGLLSALAPWKGATILDVGGGHGQYTEQLVNAGYSVTVLGSSPEADKQIRDLVAAGKCQYRIGNLLDLPVADQSYDIVISFRLLSHLRDWRGFIDELTRVARRAVILDFPILCSSNILYPLLFWLKRAGEGNSTRTFHVFREKEVLGEFRKNGFEGTVRHPQYFLPMVAHRKLHSLWASMQFERFFAAVGLTRLFGSPVILRAERQAAAEPFHPT